MLDFIKTICFVSEEKDDGELVLMNSVSCCIE